MTIEILKQFLPCRFEVLVNFGQVFALFLGAFIVDFECSLFVVNVIKCYLMTYLCGTTNRCHIYESCCKALVIYFTDICLQVVMITSLLIIFILLQFPLGKRSHEI